MKKNVKQVNEIVGDPNYKRQVIHLQPDQGEEFDAYNYPCEDEDSSSDTEPITVIIGSVSTENTVHSLNSHQYRIIALNTALIKLADFQTRNTVFNLMTTLIQLSTHPVQ